MLTLDPDAKNTMLAMEALNELIPSALDGVSPAVQARFDNALLNIAVNRVVEAEGNARAATIMQRLTDALSACRLPPPNEPVELTRMDA